MPDLNTLPGDLPRPVDDGACAHLIGKTMPEITLAATRGPAVNLGALPSRRSVIYCYPRTGKPGEALPQWWDHIPGARGCTPQACAFRDHAREIEALGAKVFGLSTQPSDDQRELAMRLHLPFPVLSDSDSWLARALRLPTLDIAGMMLIKRLTLIVRDGMIEHVFYPVFPPDESANEVMRWLAAHP